MNRRWIHAGGLALVTLAIVWLAGEGDSEEAASS